MLFGLTGVRDVTSNPDFTSAAPVSMTLRTPKRLMSGPVMKDGANMPTTCEEMTNVESL